MTIAPPDPSPPIRSDGPLPPAVTDEQLAVRLRDGDPVAGEALAKRYYTPLVRYLHRLTGSDHLAEELHQQTWLSVLEHLHKFDPDTAQATGGGFKAWLFRIATNKAHDHWRGRGRERTAVEGLTRTVAADTAGLAPAADERLSDGEQHDRLRRAIDQLPEAQRQVLMLRYYSGLKFVEIAELLGCPLNTALGRMFKANRKLRQVMVD